MGELNSSNGKRAVDTAFLTVFKTWMSLFEHSVIILVRVRLRLEFSEASVARLASRPRGFFVLCLVMDQTLVFLLLREEGGLFSIPSTHRP